MRSLLGEDGMPSKGVEDLTLLLCMLTSCMDHQGTEVREGLYCFNQGLSSTWRGQLDAMNKV
eukprot:5586157-Amphidinium_carterae.1